MSAAVPIRKVVPIPVIWYTIPARVAPVPEKKPSTFRPQLAEQLTVPPLELADPVARNVAVLTEMVPAAEPAKVVPAAVADRLTVTEGVLGPKFPTSVAEFNTPGADEPFAKVGLVAPMRLYEKVPFTGMLAAGVGIPVT